MTQAQRAGKRKIERERERERERRIKVRKENYIKYVKLYICTCTTYEIPDFVKPATRVT